MALLKLGDTAIPLTGTIYRKDGTTPLNLTGATVTITVADATGAVVDHKPVTIVDAVAGTWRYDFAAGETDRAGRFNAELEVTFDDGTLAHAPTQGFLGVEIAKSL